MTDSYRIIFQRIKIDRDAVRRTNFILATISFTDVAVIIPHDVAEFLFQCRIHFAGLLNYSGLFFKSGETATLYGARL